jgi:transitional endoplasmic reticulum ATPase
MTFKVMPEIFLKVDSAYPGDQGGGKARLDPETMLYLKISPGDIVAVEGKRRTVSRTGTRTRYGSITSPGPMRE